MLPALASPRLANEKTGGLQGHEEPWKKKLRTTLWRHTKAEEQDKKRESPAQCFKKSRKSALQIVFAIDHALELVGHGLADYSVAAARRSRPTSSTEVRYRVPITAETSSEGSASPVFRLAVKDLATGAKRWEAPPGGTSRPHLSIVSDHGSTISAAMYFLQFGQKLRCSWFSDYYHDTNNDVFLAIGQQGLSNIVYETTFVMNFEHGPWKTGTHFEKLREGFSQFARDANPDDDLYAELYDRIAFDLGQSDRVGSANHFEEVFELFRTGTHQDGTDDRVVLSRLVCHGVGPRIGMIVGVSSPFSAL